MIVELSTRDLRQLLADAAAQGVAEYIALNAPKTDRVKQAEARKMLVQMGEKPALLNKLVAAGLVRYTQGGTRSNCAKWFSRKELLAAVKAIRAHSALLGT